MELVSFIYGAFAILALTCIVIFIWLILNVLSLKMRIDDLRTHVDDVQKYLDSITDRVYDLEDKANKKKAVIKG